MLCLLSESIVSQQKPEFDGQVSVIGNFSPDNPLEILAGGRYIPKLSYKIPLDSIKMLDFEGSMNISGSVLFHPFDTSHTLGSIDPYRIWVRYSGKQFEIRAGLQKMDFGSATLLRPIQWFNQIDPRDPLQLTNGVYGVLGRYYFLNNANIWLWVLYGNEKTRGFDAIETNKKTPEIGGRLQYPVPKGEIAFSGHYRTANSTHLDFVPQYEKIPETKIGIDGKWDLTVGFWFEAVYSHKSKSVDLFTNQTFFNVGTDYTFGLGNGLNLIVEHLLTSFDNDPFGFENTSNISAVIASYPLGFFDRISTIYYYSWKGNNSTFFMNYEHQFESITGYLMAYYNPESQQGIQQNELIYNFSGPGLRIMFVYNH
jgi:hypothetical protein